jgi:hypothetical protein
VPKHRPVDYGGPFDGEEGERIVGFTGVTPSTWDELRVLFSLFKFVFPSLFLCLCGVYVSMFMIVCDFWSSSGEEQCPTISNRQPTMS